MSDPTLPYPNEGCSDEPAKPRHRLQPLTYAEFRNRPKLTWIIKRIIPRAELLVIFGEPGCGKSFLAMDMALSISRGLDWNGNRTKQGKVVYCCAEDSNGLSQRMRAYEERNGLQISDFDNITIIPVSPNFLEDTDNEILIQLIGNADLIVFDTFARITTGADENSGKDMGPILMRLQKLHTATGAMIGLVHHSGKDAARGSRGWSGLKGAADTEIEVTGTTGTRKATVRKQKNGPSGIEWHFSLINYELGVDEDGDEENSCYYEATDAPPKIKRERKLGAWEERIRTAYQHYGLEIIGEDVVVTRAVDQTPRDPDKRDKRRDHAYRALTTLADKGLIISVNGQMKWVK